MERALLALAAGLLAGLLVTLFFPHVHAFALAEGVFVLAFVRTQADRTFGTVVFAFGIAFVLAGAVTAALWSAGILTFRSGSPTLSAVLLLQAAGRIRPTGSVAVGYALIIAGGASYVRGVLAGQPKPTPKWRQSTFTVESETPDHVIHLERGAESTRQR